MRGSLVVLALAVTPLVARVSRAQDDRRDDRRETRVASHDHDRDDDRKCEARKRGNPSEKGQEHRADPRERGKKDCTPTPPTTASDSTPAPQPPPPAPAPAPAPVDTGTTSVSGYLFHDLNTNGIFDADEIGLAGWTVQVTGPVTQSTLSDGNGFYSFSGLPAGAYTVCLVPPGGWSQTLPLSGASCPNSFGYSIVAPLQVNDSALTDINFGFLSVS